MPFQKIHPEKLCDAVVNQIELLILRGILRPSERLPPERELSDKLGVSRPSLRDAVAQLQERGLLESRAGAGIYVTQELGSAFSKPLIALFASHDEAVLDYLSFRRDMEGMAAYRAARHGTDGDLEVIDTLLHKMEAAHELRNPAEEARLDADFHMAIIEASHNVIMLHMMRAMYQLLREGVFYNRQIMFRQRSTRNTLLDHHRKIAHALRARDSEGAQSAVEAHLDYVLDALEESRNTAGHEVIARQRLERERGRT